MTNHILSDDDSGEDISEDSAAPPAPPSAPAPGGFNLSQLIQDAFSGMATHLGTSTGVPTAPSATLTGRAVVLNSHVHFVD